MSDFLWKYKNNYTDIYFIEQVSYSKIYKGINKKTNNYICLKVINKNELKSCDNYTLFLEQIKREEIITNLCKSENIVNLYQKIETPQDIIFELEYCEQSLKEYLLENGPLEREKELFREIMVSLTKTLLILNQKGIMHRNINPNNIFIKSLDDSKKIIKLGDFSCSISIKDNTSDPIGAIFYSAPEIIKNLKYDERCDLWSLGVTLYELYFGELPYGFDANIFDIKKAIYDKNFIFKKSNLPKLDILFKRLLTRTPQNRMTINELKNYVSSCDFLAKDLNFANINNNLLIFYKNIYGMILKEQEEKQKLEKEEKLKTNQSINSINSSYGGSYGYIPESLNTKKTNKECLKKIVKFLEGNDFPDITEFADEGYNPEKKFCNIIYYDENINYRGAINLDSDYFEENTTGAFILCTSIDTLKLIKKEILNQNKKDNRKIFDLITTGSTFEKVLSFLEENQDLLVCIETACIFCLNLEKYKPLKNKYHLLYDVYNKQKDVINFINKFSSQEKRPFKVTKVITYSDYKQKYKNKHFKISQFYGNLTEQTYLDYYNKMKYLIKQDKELIQDNEVLIKSFFKFDIDKDLQKLEELIIKEYTNNAYHGDLNRWLLTNKDLYDSVAYFTARLMYHLNSYAKDNNKYCNENNKVLYRGLQLTYTNLIPYERAKGKIICLSSFTSTTKRKDLSINWSERGKEKELYKNSLKFSVVFIITNKYNQGWTSSGIDISEISKYPREQEVLFQPFSFYLVTDVQIDINNYTADIFLETIGKKEILEEKIRNYNDIIYNGKEHIIQIKQ